MREGTGFVYAFREMGTPLTLHHSVSLTSRVANSFRFYSRNTSRAFCAGRNCQLNTLDARAAAQRWHTQLNTQLLAP
jgi:hypothetical protein